MENDTIIKTQNLSFIYESKIKEISDLNDEKSEKLDVCDADVGDYRYNDEIKCLKCINLEIIKGKFIGLLGRTGCGKSSLVRTFNGLIPHFYNGTFFGVVNIIGKDTINEKIRDLSLHVGLVFQNPENQLVSLTVEREIAFGLENRGIDVREIRKRIENVMEFLNITHLRTCHPYELSGGEQQRVAVASILVLEPEIIILDEPTSALDQKSAIDIIRLLKKINQEKNTTIIIIEHRLDMILSLCDEIILMDNGGVIFHDTTESCVNSDLFYKLDLEIPGYIEIIKKIKDWGFYKGKIPATAEAAAIIIKECLTK